MIGRYAEYRLTNIADTIFGAAETADIWQQPKIGRKLKPENENSISHSGIIVVMVGDQQDPGGAGSTGSVEVYWPSNNSFTAGPPLPREVNEAAVVQTGNGSFLLVGGVTCCPEESADILRFDYDGWKWEVGHARFGQQCFQIAKFDPFLALDCARVEGGGRNPRKGSNFAIWQP